VNKTIPMLQVGALALVMFGRPMLTWAQSTANPQGPPAASTSKSDDVLQEVVVTAEKRAERLENVPASVQVIGSQQLLDQHVESIADLSQTTPSLEMIQAFGGPGGGGQIRGIGTQSFTRSAEGSVGIVVDGISQGNLNISNLFDIQHVEVLEGPQGTLFGLTSSAGVINILTNAPSVAGFDTRWHVDVSNNGTAGSEFGQQVVNGVINMPLSANSALRVAVTLDDYKGIEHNSFDGTDSKDNTYALRARYLWQPIDPLTINLIADVQRQVYEGPGYGPLPGFTYVYANPVLTAELASCGITPGWDNQDRCQTHPEEGSDTNYGFSAQIDYDLGPATVTSISAYRRDESGPNSQDIQAVPQEIPQIWSVGGLSAGTQFSEELRIASKSGAQLEYTAGLYYLNFVTLGYNEPDAFFHIQLPFPPFELGSPTTTYTETSNKSSAAFGQATYHITDELGVIGGMRYTYQTITDYSSPDGLQPGAPNNPGAASLDVVEHNLSGKVGLQYKFTPDWVSYATVTRGYKGPQAEAATPTTPAILVPAEIPTAYELGLKATTLQDRLSFNSALFYTRDHNYQGQSCSLNPLGVLVCVPNSVDVTTKGIELGVNARPLANWNLSGGYIYDEAVYPASYLGENPNALVGPDTTLPLGGLQIIGVPRNKFTTSSDYTLPLGPVGLFVGGDVVYKSAILEGPSPDPRFTYPAHWTLGARIGVRSSNDMWGVTIFGRDLNNAHEPITLFGGPAYIPPGVVPGVPFGAVSGVSGWMGPQSLRQVGISFDLHL
jgi:iron complex outermembrane receptor protein